MDYCDKCFISSDINKVLHPNDEKPIRIFKRDKNSKNIDLSYFSNKGIYIVETEEELKQLLEFFNKENSFVE